MSDNPTPERSADRAAAMRLRILDAAERLLKAGQSGFSMRELAAEAAVSFATPFNHFGSKGAIMLALSGRRIDSMEERFTQLSPRGDAVARIRAAVQIAAAVMLQETAVNRAVMGWLGSAQSENGQVLARSGHLWALALGKADGLAPGSRARAVKLLPEQLAFGFRGVLSFWTAGELSDAELPGKARAVADSLLLGYASNRRRGP